MAVLLLTVLMWHDHIYLAILITENIYYCTIVHSALFIYMPLLQSHLNFISDKRFTGWRPWCTLVHMTLVSNL